MTARIYALGGFHFLLNVTRNAALSSDPAYVFKRRVLQCSQWLAGWRHDEE